jgi:hypothetical protein
MISHNITRKSARFICPLLLLVASISGCTADQQAAVNYVEQRVTADGPATLRYWNQVKLETKTWMDVEKYIDNDTYIFADRDVDSVKAMWTYAIRLNGISTAQVDPELVNATRQVAHASESITAANLKADRAGQKAITANTPSLDFPALARRLSARYNLQFPPI